MADDGDDESEEDGEGTDMTAPREGRRCARSWRWSCCW
jgi:hypothetical protein